MLATLLLVAVGPWSYAGMMTNPKPPAPAAAAIAPPADPPARVPAPSPPGVALKQVAPPPPPAPPAAPTIWRLADATGQVWEHADPAQLSAFVRQRNAGFYTPSYTGPAFQYRASRCGPSGCR